MYRNRATWCVMSIIPHKISLKVVPSSHIAEVLGLWNNDLKLSFQLSAISDGNIFRKYLERNRPGAIWPIRSILSSITSRYKAFALIETPYLDLDFWDNHSRFYSGSFTRYPVWCDRFHFFEGSDAEATRLCSLLLQGLSETEIARGEKLDLPYLGYCVMRPTPSFVVSRTAVEFDSREGASIPEVPMLAQEKESRPFLKVKYPCASNLLNAHFEVESVEFIQQDPNLGHCGTAALWVSTKAMAYRFGTNRFPYGTITRQAIGGWNRERDVNVVYDPSNMDSGVSVSEMRNALAETGANSLTFMPHSKERPDTAFARICHEIYSYICQSMSGFTRLVLFPRRPKKYGILGLIRGSTDRVARSSVSFCTMQHAPAMTCVFYRLELRGFTGTTTRPKQTSTMMKIKRRTIMNATLLLKRNTKRATT